MILTSVLLGLESFPLVPFSRVLQFVTLRWTRWFQFYHFLHLSLIFLILMFTSHFVFAVIHMGLSRLKYV